MQDHGSEHVDGLALLTSQHREVEQLWAEIQAAHGRGDHDGGGELADRMIMLLSQHDAIETMVLYPALRRVEGGDRLADRSLEEHQQVRELLAQADGADLSVPENWRALEQAMTLVHAHVHQEEEPTIFPMVRTLGPEEVERLGSQFEAGMKVAPTHPHPSTPNNAAAATVVGTAAGLVDKARDAISGRNQ